MKTIDSIKNRFSQYFTFGDPFRPLLPFYVNLLYWRTKLGNNVGDYLSKVVTQHTMKHFRVKNKISDSTKKLVAIGSVLSFVGSGKTTVWGTGLMNEHCISTLRRPGKIVTLDIRSVRGPLTAHSCRKFGFDAPDIFGDPALLLPLFYHPNVNKIQGSITVIPHLSQIHKYRKLCSECDRYSVLSPITSNWQHFIQTILRSEIVISSSLHGLILSEAYGTPCVHLMDLPGNGNDFKFRDYFYSTERDTWAAASSLKEALTTEGNLLSPSVLSKLQNDILTAFPIDLFKSY